MLTKAEYPFTTGSLDNAVGTVVNYTYGNSNWKDLLTEFNGQPITYDQIGNPLTYYNGTQFTWNYGRKLASATTADGKSISYKYNDSGIRTSKTVNGVTTEYFLDGSRIKADREATIGLSTMKIGNKTENIHNYNCKCEFNTYHCPYFEEDIKYEPARFDPCISIIGGELYAFIGVTFEVRFNIDTFFYELGVIELYEE